MVLADVVGQPRLADRLTMIRQARYEAGAACEQLAAGLATIDRVA